MRFAIPVALAAALLAACDHPTTGPTREVGRPSFAASTFTENVKVSFEQLLFVPCANGGLGEDVAFTIKFHVVLHETISNSGESQVLIHLQDQGSNGTGVITGDSYHLVGMTKFQDHFGGFPIISEVVENFHIIGPGPGNNFYLHQTFHVTINANGDLTAFVDNLRIECK